MKALKWGGYGGYGGGYITQPLIPFGIITENGRFHNRDISTVVFFDVRGLREHVIPTNGVTRARSCAYGKRELAGYCV